MKKQSVINIIGRFPKEFILDDLIEKLIVLEKIELGMNDIKNQKISPHDEVKKEIKRWSKEE